MDKEERVESLTMRIEQLKARRQILQAKIRSSDRKKERKERTRRLIQYGAIFETYFTLTSLEEAEKVALRFSSEVKEFLSESVSLESWELAGEQTQKENEFIEAYILEHFGADPPDPVYATSEALKAYHRAIGFKHDTDEESFILPKI